MLYENIEKLCKINGTTITALCLHITGSGGNLITWKKGKIQPDNLQKIADYFNVSVDYLLGREETKMSVGFPTDTESLNKDLKMIGFTSVDYDGMTPEEKNTFITTLSSLIEHFKKNKK